MVVSKRETDGNQETKEKRDEGLICEMNQRTSFAGKKKLNYLAGADLEHWQKVIQNKLVFVGQKKKIKAICKK